MSDYLKKDSLQKNKSRNSQKKRKENISTAESYKAMKSQDLLQQTT